MALRAICSSQANKNNKNKIIEFIKNYIKTNIKKNNLKLGRNVSYYFIENKCDYSYYEILLLLLSKTPEISELIYQIGYDFRKFYRMSPKFLSEELKKHIFSFLYVIYSEKPKSYLNRENINFFQDFKNFKKISRKYKKIN